MFAHIRRVVSLPLPESIPPSIVLRIHAMPAKLSADRRAAVGASRRRVTFPDAEEGPSCESLRVTAIGRRWSEGPILITTKAYGRAKTIMD